MPHRILILTNRTPYPFKDGGNLAMRAMIEGYHQAGWEVYLLAMNTRRHPVPDTELKTAYSHIQYVETVPVDNNVKIFPTITNFLFSNKPNHAVRFFHQEFAEKLVTVLQRFDPEVVQLESLYLATYLPYIQRYAISKTVLRLHNVEHQVWERLASETRNPLKKWYLSDLADRIKNFEHDTWEQFDLLLPITNDDEKAVKQVAPAAHTMVVPFAIDTEPAAAPVAQQWNAYHLGAMDWLPNREAIKWFIDEVWPLVHHRHADFKFYFAGRNMPATMQRGLPAGVICEGEVADADAFIKDKKILVVPLHSGSGVRIKILEAMAIGKVVISTAIGMQGIDAVAGTHYLLANTAGDFIDKLNWCLENKLAADQVATNAIAFIKQNYSYARTTGDFIDKLETLLNHRD